MTPELMKRLIVPVHGQSVTMTARTPAQHQCPIVQETDNGTMTITWQTSGNTLELHTLREYVDTFKDVEITHEALTSTVRRTLVNLPGIAGVTVSSEWDTAGMRVVCST